MSLSSTFYDGGLQEYLQDRLSSVNLQVYNETVEYILNVDESEYAAHLVRASMLEPLEIHPSQMWAEPEEQMVPAEEFPGGGFLHNVVPGRSYRKQAFKYHLPFSGTQELVRFALSGIRATSQGGAICFSAIDFYSDPDEIKKDAESMIDVIQRNVKYVSVEVSAYNNRLRELARTTISERRAELRKRNEIAQSLGVPIRKSADTPATFRIPNVRKRVVAKPPIPTRASEPELVLSDEIYQEILQVIHEMGKVFERLPSTYADKYENTLRDHLILQLEPRFEGSTTGETFNKTGKTDILIRQENANVFVAECQWWDGSKGHTAKIDQLLGYLTWRDSKTAVVCFVRRKDFTNVLRLMDETTRQHECFVRFVDQRDETWRNYQFHLPGDPDRSLKMALLAFHMPT